MSEKVTVKDLILRAHGFPLDAEVRVKDKNGNYVEGAQIVVIEEKYMGALFA